MLDNFKGTQRDLEEPCFCHESDTSNHVLTCCQIPIELVLALLEMLTLILHQFGLSFLLWTNFLNNSILIKI